MSRLRAVQPIFTTRLFRPLHRELMALLTGLEPADWELSTGAGGWTVLQVAAHLLHGDLRELSAERVIHQTSKPGGPGFAELVALIDQDNARGVEFLTTLGPCLITDLLGFAGPRVAHLFQSLPPDAPAATNVAWAGEDVSANWMDIGREFTERWHHQMQIRDAIGAPGLTGRRWIEPLLRLSVLALRRAYDGVEADTGTSLMLRVRGDWTHAWTLVRGDSNWELFDGVAAHPATSVTMDVQDAWRSLFNFRSDNDTLALVEVVGDRRLAAPILLARSVMIPEAIENLTVTPRGAPFQVVAVACDPSQ
jgi:hypothetical protein